jgi:hypothetical protein
MNPERVKRSSLCGYDLNSLEFLNLMNNLSMNRFILLLSALFLYVFAANAQPPSEAKIHRESINKIKVIFENYTNSEDSTDSKESTEQMTKSLEQLGNTTEPEELELIINVWMYYDPTDFPTRALVLKVLKSNKPDAIKAVKNRIKNKKSWEKKGSVPYAELNGLLKEIEEK